MKIEFTFSFKYTPTKFGLSGSWRIPVCPFFLGVLHLYLWERIIIRKN